MIFLLNKKIKENESLLKSLRSFYGIGEQYAVYLCRRVGLPRNAKVFDLSRYSIRELSRMVQQECITGIELKRLRRNNIRLQVTLQSYKGFRHLVGLPVNGQNTKNNRKTARKLLRKL